MYVLILLIKNDYNNANWETIYEFKTMRLNKTNFDELRFVK